MEVSGKASVAFGKALRGIIFTFVTYKKQSYCKAKMLLGYTFLIQKLNNFPNALTGTIYLLLY